MTTPDGTGGASTLGPLWSVPELPLHFLARPEHTEPLVRALLSEDAGRTVGIHGVHGMGGLGKTVLATYVARDPAIRSRFVDGVCWVRVGQDSQAVVLLAQLGKALGMGDVVFENGFDGKNKVAAYLATRRVLVVLDDVWTVNHANALQVVGARGRILITTRNLDVLNRQGARVHGLDIMEEEQALAMLAACVMASPGALPPEAREVARACGHLPVALAMAGAQVARPGATWGRVLRRLGGANLDRLRGEIPPYQY